MLLELFDADTRFFQCVHYYTCLHGAAMTRKHQKSSIGVSQDIVAAFRSQHNVSQTLECLDGLGCSDVAELAAARVQGGLAYTASLSCVRRQRVQTFSRTARPSMTNVLFCTFALKVRFVFGALRSQRPECLCRMLRPNLVPLPQTSHLAI